MQTRKWILFGFVVFIIAVALRYLLPTRFGHFGLTFRSGGVIRVVPLNLVVFWLVLAVGGIAMLAKLIAGRVPAPK